MNYVFLAPGFEEIEAVAPVDIMRRAGLEVKTVSITPGRREVMGAHGVSYVADMTIDAAKGGEEADWLILPGGIPGATNLFEAEELAGLLKAHAGRIAAICASPAVVLARLGLLDGKRATCYPGMETADTNTRWTGEHVTVDGRIVTGQGPAWAMAFGLAIVRETIGAEAAAEVARGMLLPEGFAK